MWRQNTDTFSFYNKKATSSKLGKEKVLLTVIQMRLSYNELNETNMSYASNDNLLQSLINLFIEIQKFSIKQLN